MARSLTVSVSTNGWFDTIDGGTARATTSSSDLRPIASSIAAISCGVGPMWRRMKSPRDSSSFNVMRGATVISERTLQGWLQAGDKGRVGCSLQQLIQYAGIIELDSQQPAVALGRAVDQFRRIAETLVNAQHRPAHR